MKYYFLKLFASMLTASLIKGQGVKQHVTCERKFQKVGCFSQNKDSLKSELLITDRDKSSSSYDGYWLDWNKFDASLHSLACRCYEKAKAKGFEYFSIRFWGECWGGKDYKVIENALKDPKMQSSECHSINYKQCSLSSETECAGKANTEYVYTVADRNQAKNVDGGYGPWSSFSQCSFTCGEGISARERTCTNPIPEGTGFDCEKFGPSTETKSCKIVECPINGGLTEWTEFSDCSVTCGIGFATKTRYCTKPPPQFGGRDCEGNLVESKSCQATECPVDGSWSDWNDPSVCSATCGSGHKIKKRLCNNPKPAFGGKDCVGDAEVTVPCFETFCPVNGGWSQWSGFDDCSKSCGSGLMKRTRECIDPLPQYGGKQCVGEVFETIACKLKECPINGQWGAWSDFKSCSVSCGNGVQSRSRECNNPSPPLGGDVCIGDHEDDRPCVLSPCPVDGGYTEWSNFDTCTASCGDGIQSRYRNCSNPTPLNNGKDCSSLGPNVDIIKCKTADCPIDGKFSEWTSYSSCSVSCGSGTSYRTRKCNNPEPQYGGKQCFGDSLESKICKQIECPVDGGYTEWSTFSFCSVSCGVGTQSKTRQCTNPYPEHGGKDCSVLGKSEEFQICKQPECPTNGGWSSFSDFSDCSVTCGRGIKTKTRTCTNPSPQFNGTPCIGDSTETIECVLKSCPVHGGLSAWSTFSPCSSSCGKGTQTRTKLCNNPTPMYGGNPCEGITVESKECQLIECPVDGGWTKWSEPSECSTTCGSGLKVKTRSCTDPKPLFGGKDCVGESQITLSCFLTNCPVDGGFTQWSAYGECSSSCGDGLKTRTRTCSNPIPSFGGQNCIGETKENSYCNINPCPINGGFTEWSDFGACSEPCGEGRKSRSRKCENPKPEHGGLNCVGDFVEEVKCKVRECPIDGGLTQWSSYTECSKTCGEGEKKRSRLCTSPIPAFGGRDCEGLLNEVLPCKVKECPVNGGLSGWSAFSDCTKSCGSGTKYRTRNCTNPVPQYDGADCVGSLKETSECNSQLCPINGGFTDWSSYAECSAECGQGSQNRTRTCSNPPPANGGKDCEGATFQTKFCLIKECPINGGFSQWSSFSECSLTCGGGQRIRYRTCTNPAPAFNGAPCVGAESQTESCNLKECPVNGGLSEWFNFGNCSKECGEGTQLQIRTCTNPAPAFGGENCKDQLLSKILLCKIKECPVNGGFTKWSEFSECSASCGLGIKQRTRSCSNPVPAYGGEDCNGIRYETASCKTHECPVNGGFSEWSDFSACSNSCGNGEQIRKRSCNKPSPAHGGEDCKGSLEEKKVCNIKECPINGGLSSWSAFSTCTKSCDGGVKRRTRLCNNPAPSFGGLDCTENLIDDTECNSHSCPVNGGFSEWSAFGICSEQCGDGIQERTRSCTYPAPAYGGMNCEGLQTETRQCKIKDCPVNGGFSQWSVYSECSKECGNGEQTRKRTCNNPAPAYGGDDCQGSLEESKACKIKECPINGGLSSWSSYSDCSKSCGGGVKTRTRSCTNPAPNFGGTICNDIMIEDVPCNVQQCPIDGGMSEWSDFTPCSELCGLGSQERQRKCTNPAPSYGGKQCGGEFLQVRECKIKDCPANTGYSQWSDFSECSKSCGVGVRSRKRICENKKYDCSGLSEELQSCEVKPCPVNGGFSNWGDFDECSTTCGQGLKTRTRTCTNPTPQNGGAGCFGSRQEIQSCIVRECPVNGMYSTWSTYSECSEPCNAGRQKRTRTCTNPSPANGGLPCVGPPEDARTCNIQKCAINGGLSEWSLFSSCSKTCGNGIKERKRTCTNPAPSVGGKDCIGSLVEVFSCKVEECPIDGAFGEWSDFGECSEKCGSGLQERKRECNNPLPAYGGKGCYGETSQQRECKLRECPVNGKFTSWSSYSECTEPCNGGYQRRTRTCTDPAPAHGGLPCSGPVEDKKSCNIQKCPVNGDFTPWSEFSACSSSCGEGLQKRTRTCTNPSPAFGGTDCIGLNEETISCKVKECPVDGGFTNWSDFNECSKSCGEGIKQAIRTCSNPEPKFGGKTCVGEFVKNQICNIRECPVDGAYSQWSAYSVCSSPCNGGKQTRTRSCTNPPPSNGGAPCFGPDFDSKSCNIHLCPVHGGFTQWSDFSDCSKSCGEGKKIRTRSCSNPAPSNGGSSCVGPTEDTAFCKLKECPVDGGLGQWSDFTECSKSCGSGIQWRKRLCNNPEPAYGGKDCSGLISSEQQECKVRECPVNGGLSDWSLFSECSEPCGLGNQYRTRTCTNPSPANGGLGCTGHLIESVSCTLKPCPVNGNFSQWSEYSPCSNTCGSGIAQRKRTCTQPSPAHGGRDCFGPTLDTKTCKLRDCPINGEFSEWSAFSICYEPCGLGKQYRVRYCTNPPPSFGGNDCAGNSREVIVCKIKECPINGGLSLWTEFSTCSQTCGIGQMTRSRSCTNPPPQYQGMNCIGELKEVNECKVRECPVDGNWSPFSSFTDCSASCNIGKQQRQRECNNPAPQYGGKACIGSAVEEKSCNAFPCPVNGEVSEWGAFGLCSTSCGVGEQTRFRTCTNPAPRHGGKDCTDPLVHTITCKIKDCPVNGGYTKWSDYSPCSKTCGVGTQTRKRFCTDPAPAFGGLACVGPDVDTRTCEQKECPIDGQWSKWEDYDSCTLTCGGGIQRARRTCNNPLPKFGGADCVGVSLDIRSCNNFPCPVNGGFSSWSAYGECTTTCGLGIQYRKRFCDSPPPNFGGRPCVGPLFDARSCIPRDCPINGGLTEWSDFSPCSHTCGVGNQVSTRTCTKPYPQHGGKPCEGELIYQKTCKLADCAVNGNWGLWGSFTPCSQTCKGGLQRRSRQCNSPAPAFGGMNCPGSNFEDQACNENKDCPVNGAWGSWSPYGPCSLSCGVAVRRSRKRECNNPAPSGGGANCVGYSVMSEVCNNQINCPVNGEWSSWGPYSACTLTCGGGVQQRNRYCNNPAPLYGGVSCIGDSIQITKCNTALCTEWSSWGEWGQCSRTCGGGAQVRTRVCPGSNCVGSGTFVQVCNVEKCPDTFFSFFDIKKLLGK
uniref:HyTSR1 protein n=1 Tax=Hydra vulgaris TaxID=6087 RepID=Q2MCN4_HYDVU|nr:HyTSR1 protein [Hydra vulgaris]